MNSAPTGTSVWLGVKNSDDLGTKFDLRVDLLKNGQVLASDELDAVPGGSSGFNNAVSRTVANALDLASSFAGGDVLGIRVSVRIAEGVSGHRTGTARLWYGDATANSGALLQVGPVTEHFYFLSGFALSATPGTGPRQYADVTVDRAVGGNPFKALGTWTFVARFDPPAPASVGADGGTVATPDHVVELALPAGALDEAKPVTVQPRQDSLPGTGPWAKAIDLGPDGTTFAKPVKLTMHYDVTKLPEGVPPEALKVSTWVADHWEEVPGSALDVATATVSAPIEHFSGYGLVIWPNAVQGSSNPASLLVGQQTTITGMYYVWNNYTAYNCYNYQYWVSSFYGGYWVTQQYCYSYPVTSYYYPTGVRVDWSVDAPTVASIGVPGYSITNGGATVSPPVSALARGSAVITGRSGSAVSTTTLAVDLPPAINPFPQAGIPQNVLPVVAGQTGHVDVPISNAGGGTLTGLGLGPNADCYRGGNYPWITGSFNTTTAPAVLTLTATPPADTPAQDYDACFTITTTAAGASPYNYGVRVRVAPAFATIAVQPNPVALTPGQSAQLSATAQTSGGQPVNGIAFTWSSADTHIATVDANGRVTAVANGTIAITASASGISGSTSVVVGTPAIGATPTSLTIQVQQGSTAQGQIAITNAGTGLLTGLQVFSFSNYFTGSPEPWVTATLNTTTAPATITITAAPGTTVPAGSYQLRFDLHGANATNSPFTFYSINVTVVALGVQPVNATIAPSAASVTITVPAGQTRTAQITINNSGTDPLTNLTVGAFSSYFTGAPFPWVTASVSPTTAPATLTITASPSLYQELGGSQLRFEVMSPGATNSPYTFYSIFVVVTAPVDPPFLAAGGKSTCAMRSDKTVVCWGESSFGATSASSGTFSTIGGGFFHYCGIRPDQTLNCWGYNSDLRATPPSGQYTSISVAPESNCALALDGTPSCWGFTNDGRASPPPGTYKLIGLGWYHGCGIRPDNTLVCWGRNDVGQATPPTGTFKSVSGGTTFTCGIRTDDTLSCFGDLPAPPTGTFAQVSAASAGGHACAVRTNGTLVCWGQNDFGQANPPGGQYLQVAVNYQQSCAVRSDHVVVCWGSGATNATSVPAELQAP